MNLSERTKKILYTILFIAVVIAIAYLLYFVFFRRVEPEVELVNINGELVELPDINELILNANEALNEAINEGLPGVDSVASGSFTETDELTDVPTQNVSLAKDGTVRYYDASDGKFYKVDANGNIIQIGDAQFSNIETVTWADTTNESILEFPDGSNIYYNHDTGRQVTLPQQAEEFDFSPTSNQIAFKYIHTDPERRALAVSTPDGASIRTLETLGNNEDKVTVEWSPTGRVAATFRDFIDFNRQEVGFVGLNNENFKGTIVEGRGLEYIYSSNGTEMLYSVYSKETEYKPSLWMVEADGENIGNNRRELKINTFAEKCAFSSDGVTAYCGVPSQSYYGFGLEPDIVKDVPDDIYKINTQTGTKTKIAVPVNDEGNASYSVDTMMVSSDDSKLYFRDDNSGKLVKIDLQ